VGILPGNISSTSSSLDPGKTVPFAVNLTNPPPIHAFTIQLQYNPKVLSLTNIGIDLSGGLLGAATQTLVECIDGSAVLGNTCTDLDGEGVLTLAVTIIGNGNSTTAPPYILFTTTFNIVGRGVSQIHLLNAVVVEGAADVLNPPLLDVQLADGYFSNMLCGSQLCQPPAPSFTILPLPPVPVDKNVTFDATLSTSPNPNAQISIYTWFWDEIGSGISTYTSTNKPVIEKSFFIGNKPHFITLSVNDTYNAVGYATVKIQVTDFRLNLGVDSLTAKPVFRVLVGTPVNVTAVGENLSTNALNVTLEIFVGSTVLANMTFPNVHSHSSTVPLTVIWDTHGFSPKIYRVEAVVPPIRDSNGRIIEDDAVKGVDTNNMALVFVQLVETAGSGIVSLSLIQTTGLGIVVLIGIGVAAGFFSKRRHTVEPLPLE
jgi:hypothetical protein